MCTIHLLIQCHVQNMTHASLNLGHSLQFTTVKLIGNWKIGNDKCQIRNINIKLEKESNQQVMNSKLLPQICLLKVYLTDTRVFIWPLVYSSQL